ncbi:trypsin-like peptidase domain-containing protein [Streptomyces canus]|uniref:trypsin-like peptidase domain-containing protein n=1 Tax=Streptomyces canus TaxID=58343 RepID=UPI002E3136FF|nr:trypsin-like peptidase domain-containing protein [Streptomyces canus]
MDGWRDPLEGATVALDLLDGSGGGTGFVLTPGTVVTCAHVVAGAATLRGRIVATGTELTLTLSEDSLHRAANGLDIAFLRFEADAPAPTYVLTAPHTAFGDRLWVYGHPRGDYRAGQWAALEYQGDSRLAFDDPMPMPRGYGTPVGEGFSGSPVVNQRTGAVCGMLARSNKAGSAHMVPVSEILDRFPAPPLPVSWLGVLTDDQLRAGGYRYPGTRLRDYLTAARDAADEHPYAAVLTDAQEIPLSTVYVRQEAAPADETTLDTAPPDRDRRRGRTRPSAESVLPDHRHVLFTGGAGTGKSSLLRRLAYTGASAWLDDPARAPSYIPVRVEASELLDRPFPEALARAVGRDLQGLRRSLLPESFEAAPLPSVDWLVCVDGLDEILDPDGRGKVIRLVQNWAREPYVRFVVASRSLVTAEMNRLGALSRYSLQEFGDQDITGVAQAWFAALDVPDAPRRAAELAVGLRRGRLAEVARNPLYLTMICVVAALHELPRNPAELYARFIGVLREKGTARLRRSGRAGHGITPVLLERVHGVLYPTAEARQSGDTRPLLDHVQDLLAERFPESSADRDTVLDALTFTGLVRRHGEDLHFLHHTIQEYLAAHSLADRLGPTAPEALATVREAIAAERPNLVLFMAARWQEQGMPLEEFLRTVVDGGGWRDLLLCATILSDELVADEELTGRFTRAVIKLTDRSVTVGDLDVPTVLDRLYAVLDTAGLASVVTDPALPHAVRAEALKHHVRRGADGTAELAAGLADDSCLLGNVRVEAASSLARAGDTEGACRRLLALAEDPGRVPETRLAAAVALLPLDHLAATAALCELLQTSEFPYQHVDYLRDIRPARLSEETLTALADALQDNPALADDPFTARYLKGRVLAPELPGLLVDLCSDPAAPLYLRHRATWDLPADQRRQNSETVRLVRTQVVESPDSPDYAVATAMDGIDDAALAERVARNVRLSHFPRREAITRLIQLGRLSVARECVDGLLPGVADGWSLRNLGRVLHTLGDPARHAQLAAEAIHNPTLSVDERIADTESLADLGLTDELDATLTQMATDPAIGAADRLLAVEALDELDAPDVDVLLTAIAADATLPGDVRQDAATQLLATGERDTASRLLRRIAEDPQAGMDDRVKALSALAEVDVRAASETLHHLLDEAGLPDEHLWRLLDLGDALSPDATLRGRLETMLEDESVPTDSLLRFKGESWLHRSAVVPHAGRVLTRIAADPTADPHDRARAACDLLGLIPYPQWRTLMAGVGHDPLHSLSLHLTLGALSTHTSNPTLWQTLGFYQGDEGTHVPATALAGADSRDPAAQWVDLVTRRQPEAVTRLGHLWLLVEDERTDVRVRAMLLSWAQDDSVPVAERCATVDTAGGSLDEPWFALADDDSTPPELRVAVCEHLPASGALSRIPIARALASDPACTVGVRARAAALLAADLGEEGRAVLRSLSRPGTSDAEAHLAVAAAWAKLDVGREAEAACRRVVDGDDADVQQRVLAAARLMKWRSARGRASEVLRSALADRHAPAGVRVEAAETLISFRETAEAHLGLLRLALELGPGHREQARVLDLLPCDLRACVPGAQEATRRS